MEYKYKIVGYTNGYLAKRDPMFNGKTTVVIESDMDIKEARKALLDLYNRKFEWERPTAHNWGMAVIQSSNKPFGASKTFVSGTRSFDWDGRRFAIEEM